MRIFLSALILGVFLWSGLGACPAFAGPADAERARFGAAVEAFRGGDWQEAARGFGAAAQRGGLLADYAQFFLAEALARQGDLAAARRTAESIPARHAESLLAPLALLQAAVWASRQGDESAAASLLRRFLAQFAGHAEAPGGRYLLGLSLEAQGRGLEAAGIFRELWLTAPTSAYGEAAGDRLEALASAGVALPPPTQTERMDRAERLLAGGMSSAARQEAEALLAELPDPELTLRGLRVMSGGWRRGGQYDAAQRAADRALADTPWERRPPLLLELARLQQRVGARELALSTLARLTREHPTASEVAEALLQSGRLLEDTGRPAEAETIYRRLAADFPDRDAAGAALWRLAWLAYLRSDLPAAATEFARLSALPAGALYRHPATYWAGRVREALGEAAEARRLYGVLVTEAPRGYYGILAGQRARAKAAVRGRALANALPADPLRPLANDRRFAKATALSGLGLVEFAVSELEEIQSRSLAEPPKLYALGAAYVREERYHLALRVLRRFFADLASSGDPALPRQFWEMFYPFAWAREVGEAAARAGVDRFLVAALVREESNFFPAARSRAGARGLMQLMPDTARGLALRRGLAFGDGEFLDEPAPNLQLGATYLALLLAEFPDPRLAAAAYNAGPARVREWWAARRSDDVELFVEQIPFEETRHFVKRVMVSWEEYRRLYGEGR
ncbi:MAG: transglycosylase SLT domain-containing protein [Candidatus Rokubacteria bacterium]|nr:transglycosylase SLT domain-containing protein [Candidatus Rokubacteria bacterium]